MLQVMGICGARPREEPMLPSKASTTMPSLDIFCRRRPPLTTTEAIV
jgi:hypothetical protein